jgi:hypothetical protein
MPTKQDTSPAATLTATLVRGKSYRIIRGGDEATIFRPGKPVPISEADFERLRDAVDKHVFEDRGDGVLVERTMRKFSFMRGGEPIELPEIEDREVRELRVGERVQRRRHLVGAIGG